MKQNHSWQSKLRKLQARAKDKRGGNRAVDDGLDHSDPTRLPRLADDFVEYLSMRNYSALTVKERRRLLMKFLQWCADRDLHHPEEITRPILENYQLWLSRLNKSNGQPLNAMTQQQQLITVKTFFKWLCRSRNLLHNPASELEMPRNVRRLPEVALSLAEVETILSMPNINEPLGLRDRAIMETFYSTGIRRRELCNLQLSDLLAEKGVLSIRKGKGNKDRFVPIGQRALGWIRAYLDKARPLLMVNPELPILFVSSYGEIISPDHLSRLIKEYIMATDLGRKGSCHLFRHTCATLMLENGAEIRYIQQLLGHANMNTTSIYTQVGIHQLKKVHALTHPAENAADQSS